MLIQLLKAKLHLAAVTKTEISYHGSITVDIDLMRAVGLRPYEKVLVSNTANGARGETYVIPGLPGQGEIQLNGAMARLAHPGDRIIIMCFAALTPEEADSHHPTVAILNEQNQIIEQFEG